MSDIERSGTAARLYDKEPETTFSATLVLEPVGYLAVKVLFLCEPIKDLKVNFYETKADGKRGDKPKEKSDAAEPPELKTDEHGIAKLAFPVATGNYLCAIERQPEILVTTVEALDQPFVVTLPIGRPYFDLSLT